MSMNADNGSNQRSEINVTPLIDVLLVLLIIFMVIQPMTPVGLDTLLPQPPKSASTDDAPPQTIVVQVLGNGGSSPTYKINQMSFSKAEIEPKLASIFATRAEKVMFVKGDPALEFSVVADVIDDGRQAGADRIAILTSRSSSIE